MCGRSHNPTASRGGMSLCPTLVRDDAGQRERASEWCVCVFVCVRESEIEREIEREKEREEERACVCGRERGRKV